MPQLEKEQGGGVASIEWQGHNAGFLDFHILIQIFKSNCKVISYNVPLLLPGTPELGGQEGQLALLPFARRGKGAEVPFEL
jgi:hypothetical protein